MQDLLTVGVEPGVISAGVQMVGGRTGGAGTVKRAGVVLAGRVEAGIFSALNRLALD